MFAKFMVLNSFWIAVNCGGLEPKWKSNRGHTLKFRTTRLSINNWEGILSDPSAREILDREIESMLVPDILKYLPPSMQFSVGRDVISDWVDGLVAEATVLCAHTGNTNELVGLIILLMRIYRKHRFLGQVGSLQDALP